MAVHDKTAVWGTSGGAVSGALSGWVGPGTWRPSRSPREACVHKREKCGTDATHLSFNNAFSTSADQVLAPVSTGAATAPAGSRCRDISSIVQLPGSVGAHSSCRCPRAVAAVARPGPGQHSTAAVLAGCCMGADRFSLLAEPHALAVPYGGPGSGRSLVRARAHPAPHGGAQWPRW